MFYCAVSNSYKVCLCFIMLSVTVGYVCTFLKDQIFVDFLASNSYP